MLFRHSLMDDWMCHAFYLAERARCQPSNVEVIQTVKRQWGVGGFTIWSAVNFHHKICISLQFVTSVMRCRGYTSPVSVILMYYQNVKLWRIIYHLFKCRARRVSLQAYHMFWGQARGLNNVFFLALFFSEGHSCKLLTKNMGLLVINEDTLDVSIGMEVYVYL